MEKTIADILREVLAADRSLLTRREDLLDELDKKIPPQLQINYAIIIQALEDADIGDVFARGEANHNAAIEEAARRLKDIGMTEESAIFVVQTFKEALEWDKHPAALVPETRNIPVQKIDSAPTKVRIVKTENPPVVAEKVPDAEEIHTEELDYDTEIEVTTAEPEIDSGAFKPNFEEEKPAVSKNPIEPEVVKPKTGGSSFWLVAAVIAAAAALMIYVFSYSKTPEAPEDTSYLNAETELSLNGLDLGVDVSQLREILGAEKFIENRGEYEQYQYDNLEVEVQEGKVRAVSTNSPEMKTLRGLHAGSTYSEVEKVYGTDSETSSADNVNIYEYSFPALNEETGILRFVVNKENEQVAYISARILPKKKEPIDENTRQAARALFDFHELISAKNYVGAYQLTTENYRRAIGPQPQEQFINTYPNAISSKIVDLRHVENDDDSVVMNYLLDFRSDAGGGKILYQQFRGQVKMVRENGIWKLDEDKYTRVSHTTEAAEKK